MQKSKLKKQVAIIGSGVAGLVAHSFLINHKTLFEIEVLDIGDKYTGPDNKEGKAKGFKSYLGSQFPYDFKESFDQSKHNPYMVPSKSLGGFSVVWGAVTNRNIAKYGIPLINLDSGATGKTICGISNKHSKENDLVFQPEQTTLAVDEAKCVQCGACLLGCPYGAIWSAKDYWNDKLTKTSDSYSQVKTRVRRMLQVGDKVQVFDESDSQIGEYDYVFLAAGTFASVQILLRSKIITNGKMYQSDIQIIPFLSLKKMTQPRANLSLANDCLSIRENNKTVAYMQIYENLKELKELVETHVPIVKFVPTFIWKTASRHLGVAFVYYNDENSREILFNNHDDLFTLEICERKESKQLRKKVSKKVKSLFFKAGLFTMPFPVKSEDIGKSFHYGSLSILRNLEPFDKAVAFRNILCVDGLSLDSVPAGPITHEIARNAELIVKAFIRMHI